ncbi:MAG: iron chelate uptake ABC transporter family permease subunit, partial [Candidatus Eremiobacterota bacterium]
PMLAFGGALAAMAFIYRLARLGGVVPVDTFLLAGVVVGSFLWSLVSFLLTVARQDMPRIVFWLMGTLADARWSQLPLLFPYLVAGAAALYWSSLTLNLLTLGEETAIPLGVDAERAKLRVLLAASLVTAAAVSVSGLIGFLGLIVPHLARSVVGPDHRVLLPAAALGGGAFLVLCDTLARTVAGAQELPVGVITALLGAPFFFWLLHRRKRLL